MKSSCDEYSSPDVGLSRVQESPDGQLMALDQVIPLEGCAGQENHAERDGGQPPLDEGAVVRANDPVAMDRARAVLSGVEFLEDPHDVARGADAILVLTEWREYRDLNWKKIAGEMARPLILDGRNMLSAAQMTALKRGVMVLPVRTISIGSASRRPGSATKTKSA